MRRDLLSYLVGNWVMGRFSSRNLHDLVKEFYDASEKPSSARWVDHPGKKLLDNLGSDLGQDRLAHPNEAIYFQVKDQGFVAHNVQVVPRGNDRPASEDRTVHINYVGTSKEALEYLNTRIPTVRRIEDTTIRWNNKASFYRGSSFREFLNLLVKHKPIFRSITGPIADSAYVAGLREIFSGVAEPQGKFFRLFHTAPIMNFSILFDKGGDDLEVLFGYGMEDRFGDIDKTAVFSSRHRKLTLEFQSLFNVLRNGFAYSVNVSDPEFVRSHEWTSDVLATFKGFPDAEVSECIADCRNKDIKICTTAWPRFDAFKFLLKHALAEGCSVILALWDVQDPFIHLRSETLKDKDDLPGSIAANEVTMKAFVKDNNFRVVRCHGQASTTIFWIGNFIFSRLIGLVTTFLAALIS